MLCVAARGHWCLQSRARASGRAGECPPWASCCLDMLQRKMVRTSVKGTRQVIWNLFLFRCSGCSHHVQTAPAPFPGCLLCLSGGTFSSVGGEESLV